MFPRRWTGARSTAFQQKSSEASMVVAFQNRQGMALSDGVDGTALSNLIHRRACLTSQRLVITVFSAVALRCHAMLCYPIHLLTLCTPGSQQPTFDLLPYALHPSSRRPISRVGFFSGAVSPKWSIQRLSPWSGVSTQ